jgi:large subunit ribosomal protein L18
MGKTNPRKLAWAKRKSRVRKKLHGTAERPRLSIFRSNSHMYAQVIDDDAGKTLAAANSRQAVVAPKDSHTGNVTSAKAVGKAIAEAAQAAGVKQVVFDRNGFLYHGRVKALADAAREAGLKF